MTRARNIGALAGLLLIPAATQESLRELPGKRTGWYAEVSAGISAAEYRFSPVRAEAGVWSAPNRAQELRSRVSATGLEVFPARPLTTAPELLAGAVSIDGARAQIAHGRLSEWFENRSEGIEQGWTIAVPPAGSREDALCIGLDFRGLSVRIEAGCRSAELADDEGEPRLCYRDLAAFDATGRELDARLQASAEGVSIRVDDRGAVYPLTVDPLLTGPVWTLRAIRPSPTSAGGLRAPAT